MATCITCEAELETGEVEVGDIIPCVECGTEMEVISLRPFELEIVDDLDEDAVEEEDDDEDDDASEEEEDAG